MQHVYELVTVGCHATRYCCYKPCFATFYLEQQQAHRHGATTSYQSELKFAPPSTESYQSELKLVSPSPTVRSRTMNEEKEELEDKEDVHLVAPRRSGIESDEAESEDYSFTEELELPTELRGLKDKEFKFEECLEAELRSRGFPDLPVVLDPKSGKARLRMPTGAHNKVTSLNAKAFDASWDGVASVVNSGNNVYIQPTQPGRKIYTREPDIAFWGPDKTANVTRRGATFSYPLELDNPPKRFANRDQVERVNPDVVIQLSWKNGDSYEEKAIDDMMNRVYVSTQANNSPPKLGYLIKIRTKANKRTANDRLILRAIDVYRIPRGATKQDAINNTKGASYSRYKQGGPDVVIQITPYDLGIPSGTNSPPTFDIYASDIFNDLS